MYFLTNIATENFTNEKTNSGEYIDLQKLHKSGVEISS